MATRVKWGLPADLSPEEKRKKRRDLRKKARDLQKKENISYEDAVKKVAEETGVTAEIGEGGDEEETEGTDEGEAASLKPHTNVSVETTSKRSAASSSTPRQLRGDVVDLAKLKLSELKGPPLPGEIREGLVKMGLTENSDLNYGYAFSSTTKRSSAEAMVEKFEDRWGYKPTEFREIVGKLVILGNLPEMPRW